MRQFFLQLATQRQIKNLSSCRGDVTRKQLVWQRCEKVEGRSTFLATRNATIAVAKWGVTLEFFLATCNTNVALQVARKIASCNMANTRDEQIGLPLRGRSLV